MGTRIAGVGMYAPPKVMTNKDFETMVETTDEWIRERTGMVERRKAEPDWAYVHHELRRPGVTLMLLWEEYRDNHPDDHYQ